jgi:hypothetical protein
MKLVARVWAQLLEGRIMEGHSNHRNQYIAFILGCIGGLGQLYNGEKWFMFFVVNLLFLIITGLINAIIKQIYPPLGGIGFLLVIINGFICFNEAKQINCGEREFSGKSRLFYPFVILTIIGCLIGLSSSPHYISKPQLQNLPPIESVPIPHSFNNLKFTSSSSMIVPYLQMNLWNIGKK